MMKQKAFWLILSNFWLFLSCNNNSLIPHYSDQLIDSALVLGGRGKANKAIQLVDDHFAALPTIGVADRYRYYRFRFDLYDSYYSPCYNPFRALTYADSMVWLLKDRGLTGRLPAEYAAACSLQGEIYIELKRYSEAFRVYGFCRVVAERTGDSCLVGQYNSTMGTVRFRQGEYLQAVDLYKRALLESEGCKEDATSYHDIQGLLDNTALAYTRAGEMDSALVYYNKASLYIDKKRYLYTTDSIFPSIAMAVVYGNEALALQAKGDYGQAEDLLRKAIAINQLPGRDNATAVIEKLHLAALYLSRHRTGEAMPLLQQTASSLPPDDEGTRKLWLSLMWQFCEATGNPSGAVEYIKSDLQLTDSISLMDRHRFAGSEDNVYQLLEAQYNIEILQKNNTIKQMWLIIGAILLFTVCCIALLIRNNLRRHKRMLTELGLKNESISRRETQLEKLLGELDQRNKEKDRILQVVAHDLRSPIGGIKMMSELLTRKDATQQTEMLAMVRRSAAHCLALVNELLSGGLSGETPVLDRGVFDLPKMVAENVELMRFNAAEKQQVIEAKLGDTSLPILADAEKLGRVLNNILGNAIKFSPAGSTIRITLAEAGSCYRIAIRDQGMGIPATAHGQVFEVFSLARRPGTQGEKSFGLGLSISRQIIEAHGGKLWFESEEGKGTEFIIELPAMG
jgi:two-component system sensor histidine kinase VicK